MPAVQVTALHTFQQYQVFRDDFFKWTSLPYYQGYKGMHDSLARNQIVRSDRMLLKLFTNLIPRVPCGLALALSERRLDAIQCIEVIGLDAALHGKLPARLDDITEAPVPLDIATGKPFEYRVEGDRATISAPSPPGGVDHPLHRINYELKLTRERGTAYPDVQITRPRLTARFKGGIDVNSACRTGARCARAGPASPGHRCTGQSDRPPFVDLDVFAVVQADVARLDVREWSAKLFRSGPPGILADGKQLLLRWSEGLQSRASEGDLRHLQRHRHAGSAARSRATFRRGGRLKASQGRFMPSPRRSTMRSFQVRRTRLHDSGAGRPPRGRSFRPRLERSVRSPSRCDFCFFPRPIAAACSRKCCRASPKS